MGRRWIFLCLALMGCIKAQLQPCGDKLCAADAVCLPDNTCASHDSIEACMNKLDGDTCSTPLFTGSCTNGVCTPPVCGDSIVSGSEQCDGAVSGVDCVDYGFDTGVPVCSERCGLDVVGSCVRFGWERVLDVSVLTVYVGGGFIGLITDDRNHVQLYKNGQLVQDYSLGTDVAHAIRGAGSTIVASTDGAILRSTNGGPFEKLDISSLFGDTPDLQVADDGSIYLGAFETNHTSIFHSRAAGGWDTILDVNTGAQELYYAGGSLFVEHDTGAVDRYTGSGWVSFLSLAGSLNTLVARPGGGYFYSVDGDHSYEIVGSTTTQFSVSAYGQILVVGTDIYAGGGETYADRRVAGIMDRFDAPILGDLATDGTDLYVAGNGVFKFTGTEFAQRYGIGAQARDAKLLADGTPIMTTPSYVSVLDGVNDWNGVGSNDEAFGAGGASPTDFYIAEDFTLEHSDGQLVTTVAVPVGVSIRDVDWQASTSRLYAVGDMGLAMYRQATTWTMITGIPSMCDVARVLVHGADVYAAGTCGTQGAIWTLSGATATELHHTSVPLAGLWFDAMDNIYATGLGGTVLRIAGTWSEDLTARGLSISATSPDDIWVGGGPKELVHWDGTRWSRVRIVGAAKPHVVATPRAVYIAGASSSVLLR